MINLRQAAKLYHHVKGVLPQQMEMRTMANGSQMKIDMTRSNFEDWAAMAIDNFTMNALLETESEQYLKGQLKELGYNV